MIIITFLAHRILLSPVFSVGQIYLLKMLSLLLLLFIIIRSCFPFNKMKWIELNQSYCRSYLEVSGPIKVKYCNTKTL